MENSVNKTKGLCIISDNMEVNVSVEYTDYYHVEYQFNKENNKMTAKIIPMVPYDLNSTVKGKIGERVGKVALEFMQKQVMELQDSKCEFDILDSENREKYDVKFSLEHTDTDGHASYWKFCLKGDRGPKVYEKDVNFLLLVGTYNKPDKEPAFYLVPSDCREVKELSEIKMATSGKSVYEKYRIYTFQNE